MSKQRKTLLCLITMGLLYLMLGSTTLNVKATELDKEEQVTEVTQDEPKEENQIQSPTPAVATIYELSPEVIAYCKAASIEFSVNEYILEALVFTESHGKSDAKNGNHVGLTQLKPAYFQDVMTLLNITDPTNPKDNVRICAYKLAQWSEKYDNNVYLMLDCWHKGEGKAVAQFNAKGNSYNKTICNNADLLSAIAVSAKAELEPKEEKIEITVVADTTS